MNGMKVFEVNLKANGIIFRKRQDYRNSQKSFKPYDEGNPPQRVELHGFSDASQQSYGACIYLKSIFKIGKVFIHLIASKSRLTPIKEITIPILELLGNLILCRLTNLVKSALSKTLSFVDDFYL